MSDSAFKLALACSLGCAWVVEIWAARTLSPSGRLIANPLLRRFGWTPLFLGAFIVLIPYYNTALAVLLLGPSLFVAAQNLERVWLPATLGEEEYRAILLRAAASRRLGLALLGCIGAGFLIALAGGALLLLSLNGRLDWSFWFGSGIVIYGLGLALGKSLYLIRLHREVASLSDVA